jgi:hypothetical protein
VIRCDAQFDVCAPQRGCRSIFATIVSSPPYPRRIFDSRWICSWGQLLAVASCVRVATLSSDTADQMAGAKHAALESWRRLSRCGCIDSTCGADRRDSSSYAKEKSLLTLPCFSGGMSFRQGMKRRARSEGWSDGEDCTSPFLALVYRLDETTAAIPQGRWRSNRRSCGGGGSGCKEGVADKLECTFRDAATPGKEFLKPRLRYTVGTVSFFFFRAYLIYVQSVTCQSASACCASLVSCSWRAGAEDGADAESLEDVDFGDRVFVVVLPALKY